MFFISYFIHYLDSRNHSHNLNSIATSKFMHFTHHLAADRSTRDFGHIGQFAVWLPLAVDCEKYCVVCSSFWFFGSLYPGSTSFGIGSFGEAVINQNCHCLVYLKQGPFGIRSRHCAILSLMELSSCPYHSRWLSNTCFAIGLPGGLFHRVGSHRMLGHRRLLSGFVSCCPETSNFERQLN